MSLLQDRERVRGRTVLWVLRCQQWSPGEFVVLVNISVLPKQGMLKELQRVRTRLEGAEPWDNCEMEVPRRASGKEWTSEMGGS